MSIFGNSGGADGAARLYQFKSDSLPDRIVDYTVSMNTGDTYQAGVYLLKGARTGDSLTVVIDERPFGNGDFVEPLIVIPAAFKSGIITIVNRSFSGYFLVSEDYLGVPAYNESFQLVPGVERLSPGFVQLTVLSKPTPTGDLITELLSVSQRLHSVHNLSWRNQAAVAYEVPFVDEIVAPNPGGQVYMSSTPPYDVRVYSDRPVQLHMTVRTWDMQTKSWSQVSGEYIWTTLEDGSPDFMSIVSLVHLPSVSVPGAGGYSVIPYGSRILLTLVDPQDPGLAPLTVFDGSIGLLGAFTQV